MRQIIPTESPAQLVRFESQAELASYQELNETHSFVELHERWMRTDTGQINGVVIRHQTRQEKHRFELEYHRMRANSPLEYARNRASAQHLRRLEALEAAEASRVRLRQEMGAQGETAPPAAPSSLRARLMGNKGKQRSTSYPQPVEPTPEEQAARGLAGWPTNEEILRRELGEELEQEDGPV